MAKKLEGKTAVITGGSRGIGKAIALRLARDGANIGILNLHNLLGDKAAEVIMQFAGEALALQCDITNYQQTQEAVAMIHREFGSIDILVNNAGIDKSQFFADTDPSLWDKIIDVNYKGFLIATHVCLPYMIKQQRGSIISLGSDAGRVGTAGEVIYCGTKGAIVASSKALARELAQFNIRVNCVSPGPVQTDLWNGLHEEEKGKKVTEAITRLIPMKRIATPQDIADVVAFFVSEDARYITGQVLSVDGGLTMIG